MPKALGMSLQLANSIFTLKDPLKAQFQAKSKKEANWLHLITESSAMILSLSDFESLTISNSTFILEDKSSQALSLTSQVSCLPSFIKFLKMDAIY